MHYLSRADRTGSGKSLFGQVVIGLRTEGYRIDIRLEPLTLSFSQYRNDETPEIDHHMIDRNIHRKQTLQC